jgi:uncharacterized phage protein (TIGR01671 family)
MTQREIKFRAWWPSVKEMRYFVPGNFEDTRNGWAMTFIQNENSDTIFLGKADLMQYTGLKDKAGKEIWEGDVVGVTDIDGGSTTHAIVFKDGCFTIDPDMEHPSGDYGMLLCTILDDEDYALEVIGNIHESPELLKGEL